MMLADAFESWHFDWSQCRLMRRVAARLVHTLTSHVFAGWVDAVDMMVSERAEEKHEASLAMLRADIEAQREAANARAVAQIVSRWLEVNKSKCFLQWHWWAQTMVSQRRSAKTIMLRMSQSCCYSALLSAAEDSYWVIEMVDDTHCLNSQ